jgi:hypothetical protein
VPVLPAAHLVHFYATPEGLAQSLCGFFAEPLKRGESVIIVARPEHRRAVDAALRDAGVDLAAEVRAGRYRSLDVTETLATLLEDGRLSPARFHAHARAMVDDARRRQEAGELAADLDPAYVLLILFAATLAPTVLPQVVRRVTGLPADSPEFLGTYAEQLGKIMSRLAAAEPAG